MHYLNVTIFAGDNSVDWPKNAKFCAHKCDPL